MDLEHIVIENIKRIRKEKHITQERLAEYCDTSVSYIGLMETYKNIPKLSTIERIAHALNVPAQDLFAMPGGNSAESQAQDKAVLRARLKEEILRRLDGDLDAVLSLV